MNEQSKNILEISEILFKNNVPIEEAQLIARYIGQLLGENKRLKKELESLKSSDEEWLERNDK